MNEALPREGDTLRVSDDKAFCMEQMRSSMKKNLDEAAWPTVQYLWKLHPILSWVNDKSSLLFKRDQAPVIGVPQKLTAGECIYIVTPDEIFDSYKKYCNEHETWWSETGLSDETKKPACRSNICMPVL